MLCPAAVIEAACRATNMPSPGERSVGNQVVTIVTRIAFSPNSLHSLRAIAVEPSESQVLAGKPAGAHRIQGIGAGFVPVTYDASVVDEVVPVTSERAIAMRRRLAEEVGLLVGISSGAAVEAAAVLAERRDREFMLELRDRRADQE